jgi:hypothetical protein
MIYPYISNRTPLRVEMPAGKEETATLAGPPLFSAAGLPEISTKF